AGGIVILGLFQLLPLPEGLVRALSPNALRSYEEASEILAALGSPHALAPRLSIAPEETRAATLVFAALTALLAASSRLLRGRHRRRLLSLLLLSGMILHLLWAASRPGPDGRFHGAFVNANHLAGYLGIGLAVAFGRVWNELLQGRDRLTAGDTVSDRFERRILPVALWGVAWMAIAAGIALTQSRGAVLAAAATTLGLVALGLWHPRVRRRRKTLALAAAATLAVAIAGALLSAGRGPISRFYRSDPVGIGADTRGQIWQASLEAWRQFPAVGSGLGTFREAFRSVQPREIEGQVEQAHNDFLQILVTGGVVGAALAVIAFGATLLLLLRAWWRQMHREESAFLLGGIGAVLFVVLHGIVEFDMSIPAIPATLAVVVGGAWAAGRAR
ncbi:MAG TPA: O-antigen ligase family protein, partial [Thermoanaerobaculia bacterium]